MADPQNQLLKFINRHGGLLPLKPCMVARGYRGGGRLAGRGCGCVRRRDGKYLVERWIASSTRASWGDPDTQDGFSMVAGLRPATRLCDALQILPEPLLGPDRAAAHQGEFRVLTKILDPFDPIGFHFHQKDEDVRTEPERFRGERFGKDEAYYFLPGSRGSWPYTHVGILPGISREQILAAMVAGWEALLDITPYFLPRPGTGFFVPAGVVHCPGTVLTLEIQQPSDVGAGFGLRRGQTSSAAIETLRHVDLARCQTPGIIKSLALEPSAVEDTDEGVQVWWIVAPGVTPKFSAKRLIVSRSCMYRENDCLALLAWSGQGIINGHSIHAGKEFFVPWETATAGLRIEPATESLELFAVFAGR